tara:strand:+ start:496 stop:654 length:159 start_codon:yes stop_codon:yes gene_type:complete
MKFGNSGVNDRFSVWNADATPIYEKKKKDSEFLDRVMYISLGIILGYFILRD